MVVYLGHGGARAAEYVKQNLFSNLISHPKFISDTKSAIGIYPFGIFVIRSYLVVIHSYLDIDSLYSLILQLMPTAIQTQSS